VLYRVLFHYLERFLAEHENRFEKEYGFLRPINPAFFCLSSHNIYTASGPKKNRR